MTDTSRPTVEALIERLHAMKDVTHAPMTLTAAAEVLGALLTERDELGIDDLAEQKARAYHEGACIYKDERDAARAQIAEVLAETGDDARTDGPGEARARITRIHAILSRGAKEPPSVWSGHRGFAADEVLAQGAAEPSEPREHRARQEPPWPPFPEANYMLTVWKCWCGWESLTVTDKRGNPALEVARTSATRHEQQYDAEEGNRG